MSFTVRHDMTNFRKENDVIKKPDYCTDKEFEKCIVLRTWEKPNLFLCKECRYRRDNEGNNIAMRKIWQRERLYFASSGFKIDLHPYNATETKLRD